MKSLVIVDMQNDFMPGGALGVPGAFDIVPIINSLMPKFPAVLATKDWHPPNHASFAANHPGKQVKDIIEEHGVLQILWPVHCVRGTPGSEFVSTLDQMPIESIFYKGTDRWIDSYSAFFDNARRKATGLEEYLETHDIDEVYIVGVATDYCVLYSAIDAVDLGFSVYVIEDACKGINLQPEDIGDAYAMMREKGVHIISSADVLKAPSQKFDQ